MTEASTGGCSCGSVRYSVMVRLNSYACHCSDCQTRSGSAFSMQQIVKLRDLNITGVLIQTSHIHPSGALATTFVCPRCSTRIYATSDRITEVATIRAGTFDNSAAMAPGFHVWVRSKQPWIKLLDDVPSFETEPRSPIEWKQLLMGPATDIL